MCPRRFLPERAEAPADYWAGLLDGRNFSTRLPRGISEPGHGGKFTPDGHVNRFPGNTFICHIDPESAAHAALTRLQVRLKELTSAGAYIFMPPESFHMTVFCGLSGDPLGEDGWPDGAEPGTPLEAFTSRWAEILKTIPGPRDMRIRGDHLRGGYVVNVEPADPESFDAVWQMRDRLADLTCLHRPDHDRYQFHITLCYRRTWQPPREIARNVAAFRALFEEFWPELQDIRLGRVEFCTFADMHHFETLMRIG